jgi:CRISPR-associated RAMP protein (TIGR02581 family)
MFDTFQSRITVDGYLTAESGLRVGTGRASALVGSELPVIRDYHDRPFIPGSSLKGALRGHLEAVVRGMAPDNADMRKIACDPTDKNRMCVTADEVGELKDRYRGEDVDLTAALIEELCLACQTFGSPWLASPVRVRDLPVVTDEWFGQFDVRDGVAIERDKGTAVDGKLYNYEVVPPGTRFKLHIEAENLEDWRRGLLWLGLRAMEAGRVALGGFTSRGLGWVRLEEPEVLLVEGAEEMLKMLAGAEAGEVVREDEAKSWVSAFRERLNRMNGKGAGDA